MSKIGSTNIIGQPFKPIITSASYNDLLALKNSNTTVESHNALIFSIPQDADGNDKENEGSIWLTDSNGYLYNISKPNKANT